ncbi:MAG TPA: GNAT family N-acetyltransferase [Candidatus Limnocylindrales bacterium]|nr:GNAT family N-acetyltransferase [Candidatus Limnocylindrales bacterium]
MSGSTTTRLDGPLVTLEVPGPEHLPAIWKVYLDAPDYFEAVTGSADFDPGDVEMMYEDALSDESRFYFAVRRSDTKSLIGTIEIETGSDEHPAALRGLVISQAERGKGYGRAALEMAEKFLMDDFGIPAIAAEVPDGYDDGERFLQAMGYRQRRLRSGDVRWVKRLAAE